MEKGYTLTTEFGKMNLDFIHSYLSEKSYWAKGRSMELVRKSMANSICFGLFEEDKQIGFARVATDYVVFAWLMDLFIDPEYRNHGLGQMLLQYILEYPDLQTVNSMGLRTQDAHDLYRKFGFGEIPDPDTWMFKKCNS